jgi:hypothetical protein
MPESRRSPAKADGRARLLAVSLQSCRSKVGLFKNTDASTPFHESGHSWPDSASPMCPKKAHGHKHQVARVVSRISFVAHVQRPDGAAVAEFEQSDDALEQSDDALEDPDASGLACGHSVSRCTSAMKSALAIDGSASSYSPR